MSHHDNEAFTSGKLSFNPVNFSLTAEGGKNFFSYLKKFNLSNDPYLIFLSPNHHFFYDEDDFKGVRTLINLKQLNFINDIDTFLYNLFLILPPDVNFIGCFSDSKNLRLNGFKIWLTKGINNIFISRKDRNLDKEDVLELLEKNGFKIVDMTEMNGLTYFYSQNTFEREKITA
jgi:hypothetical protein